MSADNIRWNIWRLNAKGQRVKWLGSILDPETGFDWLKTRGLDPKMFAINNVPPAAGATQNPQRVMQGMEDGTVVQTGEVIMPKPKVAEEPRRAVARKPVPQKVAQPFDWSESDRKQAALRAPQRASGSTVTGNRSGARPVHAVQRPTAPAQPVDPKMRKDAEDLLVKHKADEAADVAAGKVKNA